MDNSSDTFYAVSSNSAPWISWGTNQLDVTEDGTSVDTGVIHALDADSGETLTPAFYSGYTGYGYFTVGNGEEVQNTSWGTEYKFESSFELDQNSSNLNNLDAGESVTLGMMVNVTDSSGTYAAQSFLVNVTIHGADEPGGSAKVVIETPHLMEADDEDTEADIIFMPDDPETEVTTFETQDVSEVTGLELYEVAGAANDAVSVPTQEAPMDREIVDLQLLLDPSEFLLTH